MTTFVHDGDSIDYTPAADVAGGDVVVQEDLVGVVKLDIKAGELGALAVKGVFDFPKDTGAGTGIAAGKIVYWDAGADFATETAAGNKLLGKSILDAADTDGTVRVRLSQ